MIVSLSRQISRWNFVPIDDPEMKTLLLKVGTGNALPSLVFIAIILECPTYLYKVDSF